MENLIFYGASDDRLEIDGDICETVNTWPDKPQALRVEASGGILTVFGYYAPKCIGTGDWVIGVATHDEKGLPGWNIHYKEGEEDHYSPRLVMDVPDDVKIVVLDNDGAPDADWKPITAKH